jgi:hypothetical protein
LARGKDFKRQEARVVREAVKRSKGDKRGKIDHRREMQEIQDVKEKSKMQDTWKKKR